ncbi:hypothetical protein GF369_03130 [Candidatus Peregrinibacteria bacterium]|nr:hypothetical protein [Candidatus Peregrinibacteria bacterium]
MRISMDNNRLMGMIILVAMAFVGVVYAAWVLFFNKGQVLVEGVPPFTIQFNGQAEQCLEDQCVYDMAAKRYSYVISKDGYFDQKGTIEVKRGKQVMISYEATFEAKTLLAVDYPLPSLPAGYANYQDALNELSLFHLIQDEYQLLRLPKKIRDIVFAPSGTQAIVLEEEAALYYDTQTYEQTDYDMLADAYTVEWNDAENALYAIVFDDVSKKDALVRMSLSDETVEKEVYFLRDIDTYDLSVSPDERYVMLVDTTSPIHIVYIIDREEMTRNNIFEGHAVHAGLWSRNGRYVVFEGREKQTDVNHLWLYDTQTAVSSKLTFYTPIELMTAAPEEKAYMVSSDEYTLSGQARPYFSHFDTAKHALTLDELTQESSYSLHEFSFSDRQTYFVTDISESIDGAIERIEADTPGSIVRILVDDRYYDIKVRE